MKSPNGGRTTLVALTSLILVAGSLAAGGPAQAAPEDEGPTIVQCERRPNLGVIRSIRPAGPGKVRVTGAVRACRKPTAKDAAAIGWSSSTDGRVPDRGFVRYRRLHFDRVVRIDPSAQRVCLFDTPDKAMDCYQVRVPQTRQGEPGVPVVGGRTTTVDATVQRPIPWCGACW